MPNKLTFVSVVGAFAIGLSALMVAGGAAAQDQKTCMITGVERNVADDATCPFNVRTTLRNLEFTRVVERIDPETEELALVEEVDSFDIFVRLADLAGFTGYLNGTETPPKLRGPGIKEGTFTIFVPSDEAFNELPEGVLASLMDRSQLTDEKRAESMERLRHFVAAHILTVPLTKRDFRNSQMRKMTLLDPGSPMIYLDGLNGGLQIRRTLPSGANRYIRITKLDIEAANGVIHVISAPVVVPPALVPVVE